MGRKLFSLTEDRSIYFNDTLDKIEIENCPSDKKECVRQLPEINKCFLESHYARLDKDYLKSIESLQLAFEITYQIDELSCDRCAGLFRSIVISSMETLCSDLKDMTSGWFSAKHYRKSFQQATTLLEEMKRKTHAF